MALPPEIKKLRQERKALSEELHNPTPEDLKEQREAAEDLDHLFPPDAKPQDETPKKEPTSLIRTPPLFNQKITDGPPNWD